MRPGCCQPASWFRKNPSGDLYDRGEEMRTEKLPDGDRGKNEQNSKERKEQAKYTFQMLVILTLYS